MNSMLLFDVIYVEITLILFFLTFLLINILMNIEKKEGFCQFILNHFTVRNTRKIHQ